MSSVTIKIAKFDPARAGYPVDLLEDGQPPLQNELLPGAAFLSGEWRVEIGNGVAPAAQPAGAPEAKDIVETVMMTPGAGRAALDWLAIGNKLFTLLFPAGPLRTRFDSWGADRRLFLDIEPPELVRVPWELAQSDAPTLLLAVNFAMTRLHAGAAAPFNSDWPLRILILIGCSAVDEVTLEVDKEIDAIRRAFISMGRSVDIYVLRTPLWDELQALIRLHRWKPHVLHFVGHTGIASDNSVGLQIDRGDTDNAGWVWSTRSVQVQLGLTGTLDWTPRFVFLNACRTGVDPGGAWGFQRSFIRGGAHCVLTMQADVLGSLAGLFAGKLYEAIARGESVQDAALAGRMAVYGKQQAGDLIDWALPALCSSGTDVKLFKPRAPPDDVEFGACVEFREARVFANCDAARRLLTHWICPVRVAPPQSPNNIVLVAGEVLCGKSHILKWAMESWVLAGARVRYIEMHDTRKKDFLAILREVRDGDGKDGKRFLQRRLPPEHFRKFNWTLNNLLRTGQPGVWVEADHPEAEIADAGDPVTARGEDRLEPAVCSEFLAALQLAAAEKPLILVFDKFTTDNIRLVRPEDFSQLVTHLFTRIAKDAAGRIKVVFSATPGERQAYSLDLLPNLMTCDVPDDIPNPDLVRYAVEMLRFKNEEDVRDLATALLRFPTSARGVARLAALKAALPELISQIQRMQ